MTINTSTAVLLLLVTSFCSTSTTVLVTTFCSISDCNQSTSTTVLVTSFCSTSDCNQSTSAAVLWLLSVLPVTVTTVLVLLY